MKPGGVEEVCNSLYLPYNCPGSLAQWPNSTGVMFSITQYKAAFGLGTSAKPLPLILSFILTGEEK
jgi:hypothetical protein